MDAVNVNLGLEGTHVVVTGGAGMIGSKTVSAFLSAGATVSIVDIGPVPEKTWQTLCTQAAKNQQRVNYIQADISNEDSIKKAWQAAEEQAGAVQTCVALAALDLSLLPHHDTLADMPLTQWRATHEVNVQGTFLTAREWLRGIIRHQPMENVSLIIVGSESGLFGEKSNADYASSKSAVQGGLLQSLKADVPRHNRRARVNAIAPGPVDTQKFREECAQNPEQYWLDAQGTVALGKPVAIESVARSIVYLASEAFSSNVHGQILRVDSGKFGKVMWTREESG